MERGLAAAGLAALLLAHGALAAELRTAAQLSTAPKFIEQKARVTGLCIDIQTAIEKIEPGLRFTGTAQWEPAIRIEFDVANGQLDAMCGISRNAEREARIHYIEPPLFPVSYHLVARADDPVLINSWADVRALGPAGAILMVHGFGPVARLREVGGLTIDDGASDTSSNLQKLVAGRRRFCFLRSPGIAGEVRKAGVTGKVRILPAVMERVNFYFALGRHVAPATRELLARAVAKLEANGELKRLADKWNEGAGY